MKLLVRSLLVTFILVTGAVFVACNSAKGTVTQKSGGQVSGTSYTIDDKPQHRANPYPVIPQKDFTRVWKGSMTCNNDKDESLSTVTITSKDSANVYVSGFFNSKDSLVGKIRGYVVIVALQQIHLLEETGKIDGSFSLSNDRQMIYCYFIIYRNGQIDPCSAVYHAVK